MHSTPGSSYTSTGGKWMLPLNGDSVRFLAPISQGHPVPLYAEFDGTNGFSEPFLFSKTSFVLLQTTNTFPSPSILTQDSIIISENRRKGRKRKEQESSKECSVVRQFLREIQIHSFKRENR